MAITIENEGPDGVIHTFTSELDSFVPAVEWIKKNKSKEIYDAWVEFSKTGVISDITIDTYNEWLVDQKIHHVRETPGGDKTESHYSDFAKN
jgi:hypothetical protein